MRYLWMGASPQVTTGYGRVGNHVVNGLRKKGVDMFYFAMQNIGIQEKEWILPVKSRLWGEDILDQYIKDYKIDCIITLVDVWVPEFAAIQRIITKNKIKWICHVTANSVPFAESIGARIANATCWVAPSKFVRDLMVDAGFPADRVVHIPHGIDTKIFKPFSKEEKEKAKETFGYKDKFVFLDVGTNKGFQKNWPAVLYAYKLFLDKNKKDRDKFVLHLQTTPTPADGGYDLNSLVRRFGIGDRVFTIQNINKNSGFTEEEMTKLYNMSDVLLSTTIGESFSLPVLEAEACGIPCIMTDFSTCEELIKEPQAGFGAKVAKMFTTPLVSDQAFVDEEDMADKMQLLYTDKKLRERMSKNAAKFAVKHDWKKDIIPKWNALLKKVEEIRPVLDYNQGELGI